MFSVYWSFFSLTIYLPVLPCSSYNFLSKALSFQDLDTTLFSRGTATLRGWAAREGSEGGTNTEKRNILKNGTQMRHRKLERRFCRAVVRVSLLGEVNLNNLC